TNTGLDPSESRRRSRSSSGPEPVAHLSGANAWNCAATGGPQTSRKRLDLNIASATYFGWWSFRQLKTLNAAFCPRSDHLLSTGFNHVALPTRYHAHNSI